MVPHSYWLSADDLELDGEWRTAWNNYTAGLEHGVIRLKDVSDTVQWSHNQKDGKVTVALVYDLIVKTHLVPVEENCLAVIWRCKIPLKIKCFIWLAIENHIFTCDNLTKRGWFGPSRCCLCNRRGICTSHFFYC